MWNNEIIILFKQLLVRLNSRLANKLIIIFFTSVSIIVITIIYISQIRTSNILTNNFIDNNKMVLSIINQSFNDYMQQINEFSLLLRNNDKFLKIIFLDGNRLESQQYISSEITNMFYSRKDIEELRLYLPSIQQGYYISRTDSVVKIDNIDISTTEWYEKATRNWNYMYVEPAENKMIEKPKRRELFTLYRSIINVSDGYPLAIVAITFNNNLFNKILGGNIDENGQVMCIFNRDNEPFYISNSGLDSSKIINGVLLNINSSNDSMHFEINLEYKKYIAVYNTSSSNEWKFVKLSPIDMINKKVQQTKNISLIIGSVFILLLIVLIMIVSNAITVPLKRLSNHMDNVGDGNFNIEIKIEGNDEITHLAKKFNLMVYQINELINERYIAKISEKTAQLKALEAQINPHFLNNSLQVISTKSLIVGQKGISRMVEVLAHTLRYSIKGGDIVNVSKEIEHVKYYLELQKERFDDRLNIDILVDDSTYDSKIPKLSIYTIVENSIKYGLETMTESITINIKAFIEGENIIIQVIDNGPGMDAERLSQVLNELNDLHWLEKSSESIGLKNLNTRLKLLYGNRAHLEIQSSTNNGTEICMILPLENKEE